MIPVRQTLFGTREGNCWSACIASITGIPISEIPNFCVEYKSYWWEETLKWLEARGLTGIHQTIFHRKDWSYDGYWLASGKSPRADCDHCVVFKGNKMVHDPHPSNDGIEGKPLYATIIIPIDLEQFRGKKIKRKRLTSLERALLKWWRSHRPINWTKLQHINNPCINIVYDRSGIKEMARIAAKIASERKRVK